MRLLSTIALLILVAALSAAPVPKELKVRPDAERIQGVWIVTQGQPGAKGYRWTFEGEKLFAGGTPDTKGIEYTTEPITRPAKLKANVRPPHSPAKAPPGPSGPSAMRR